MGAEMRLPLATLSGFLLVLARMAGVFVFLPLPGLRSGPEAARAVLALGCTLALAPVWPAAAPAGAGEAAGWLLTEAALGMGVGLSLAFLTEVFLLAAQVMGLEAGYAYASTIDPATQADASILLVFAQFAAGLLFLSLGLDREVLRIFARSLETCPPGSCVLNRPGAEAVLRAGSVMFSAGMRLAMPVLALLVLVDVGLALLGRLNAQLQLLTLAFPVKMLAALVTLAALAGLFPAFLRSLAGGALAAARVWIGA